MTNMTTVFFQAVNQAITAYAREAYPAATQEGYSGSLDAFVLLIQYERNTYFDRKNYSDFLFEQAQKLLAEDAALAEAVKGFSLEFEFTSYNLTYQKDNVLPEGGYPVNGFFRYTSSHKCGRSRSGGGRLGGAERAGRRLYLLCGSHAPGQRRRPEAG